MTDMLASIEIAKQEVKYRPELITPAAARRIAAENDLDFSKLSPRDKDCVMAYARAMVTGRWVINGNAVIFDEHGRLIDGALRILAAIQCGCSFPTFVVYNIRSAAKYTIDTHVRRTTAQQLHIEGREHSTALAAVVTMATAIAADGRTKSKKALSPAATSLFLDDHPAIEESIRICKGTRTAKAVGLTLASSMRFLTNGIDPALSPMFMDALEKAFDGSDASANARALVALIAEGPSKEGEPRIDKTQALIRAWNGFVDGKGIPRIDPTKDAATAHLMTGLPKDAFESYLAADRIVQAPSVLEEGEDVTAFYERMIEQSPAQMRVGKVSPTWARQKLLNNGPSFEKATRNRPVVQAKVRQMARDMTSKRWFINGQTIKLSKEGNLIDGQHRLFAVIEADEEIPVLVVTGLDQSVFSTLDMGASRPFADHLLAEGIKNPNEIQGALRVVWQYANRTLGTGEIMTNGEMHAAWSDHAKIADHAIPSHWVRDILNRYISIAFHYMFSAVDAQKAMAFFRELAEEDMLDDDDPILALINGLREIQSKKRGVVSERERVIMVIKAWNHFVVQGRTGGLRPAKGEKVPEIDALPPECVPLIGAPATIR